MAPRPLPYTITCGADQAYALDKRAAMLAARTLSDDNHGAMATILVGRHQVGWYSPGRGHVWVQGQR